MKEGVKMGSLIKMLSNEKGYTEPRIEIVPAEKVIRVSANYEKFLKMTDKEKEQEALLITNFFIVTKIPRSDCTVTTEKIGVVETPLANGTRIRRVRIVASMELNTVSLQHIFGPSVYLI